MSKSDFLENKVLDHVLGGPDYARPATVYVAHTISDFLQVAYRAAEEKA